MRLLKQDKKTTTYLPFDHLCSDVSLDDMTLSHVPDAKHQTRLAVPLTYYSIPREKEGLRSFLRSRQLSEYYADHKGLQDHSCHRLYTHNEYRLRTLVRRVLRAIPASLYDINIQTHFLYFFKLVLNLELNVILARGQFN